MGRGERLKNLFRSKAGQIRQATDSRQQSINDTIGQIQGGSTGVMDRVGHVLQQGDVVVYDNEVALQFQVMAAAPVLDRNMPRGRVQITLVGTVPVNCAQNQPTARLMLIARNGLPLQPQAMPSPTTDTGANGKPKDEPSRIIVP